MECQEERTLPITDGVYCGEGNSNCADVKQVLRCPVGHVPKSSCYTGGGNGHIYVSFPKNVCMSCPHKEECREKEHKQVCSFTISATAQYRAEAKRHMGTEEFKLLNYREGTLCPKTTFYRIKGKITSPKPEKYHGLFRKT